MISVCGPNEATEEELDIAYDVGRLIAQSGHALVCGGRGGVMEAVSRGAKTAGGVTIGILPDYEKSRANQFIDYPIPTGLGHARNAIVAAAGDSVIVIGGGFGTLSEIGLALKMGQRVVHVHSWDLDSDRLERFEHSGAEYLPAASADEAVSLALGSPIGGPSRKE